MKLSYLAVWISLGSEFCVHKSAFRWRVLELFPSFLAYVGIDVTPAILKDNMCLTLIGVVADLIYI